MTSTIPPPLPSLPLSPRSVAKHLLNVSGNTNPPARTLPVVPQHPLAHGLPPIFTSSTTDVMLNVVSNAAVDSAVDPNAENAFFVCDLSKAWEQVSTWTRELGPDAFEGASSRGVDAFYAVKCNPDPVLLCLLASLGLGFDCASHGEISLMLSLGIDPSRIIYANPIKTRSFIRYAAAHKVDLMTFDNSDELFKVKREHPNARLVLRLAVDDEGSLCRFSSKFGAHRDSVVSLLHRAKDLDLDVVGVSFHVGSGCANLMLYDKALQDVRWTFDQAAEVGYSFDFVDIGGGFESATFPATAAIIRDSLRKHFSDANGKLDHLHIIAEPGRFFASEAFQMATNIIGRRTGADSPKTMYYINEGAYGAFNSTIFDHQVVHPQILARESDIVSNSLSVTHNYDENVEEECTIWGPSCDSIDIICSTAKLPRLDIGDWLTWSSMGAYTSCAASNFNGFKKSAVHYTTGDGALFDTLGSEIRRLLDRNLESGLHLVSRQQQHNAASS